ncbi:conserved hypothetical protein [Shewanella sediminis HAW-EB3]|uniref:Uncharacterized protein n=1 Tax=Shewanella sediminis (strain HAW-EB3) TaxID=425104 RepID=A8FUP7_SHESH|nr:hypothetical protein [Shewanella sediminis]ABV36570.1 conserved hypothetical protein [Shewanella sediminis HAW-EB3]
MKPNTTQAMQNLIEQIKAALPFGVPEHEICAGVCVGCPKKLMEYISSEVEYWECKLENDEKPSLLDLSDLARVGSKVHRSMVKNKLV